MFEQYISDDFQGCIFITDHSEVIHSKSYGYADLSNQIPNTRETKFATASAGKVFVAVGILQLIEQGQLKFDDTIGDILPIEWKEIDKTITVKELLTHRSGIPDYFDESVMEDYDELWREYPNYKIRTSADLYPLFIDKPMMYKRGERFQYNNTGFVVLGLIIEAVTKQPFDEYLQKNIFDMANMDATGYYELDRLPAKCANNYIYDKKWKMYYTNIYSVDVKGTGAGGAFTTVDDVASFWSALLNYQLLSEDMTNEMLKVQVNSDYDDNYGYGIWLNKKSAKNILPYFTGCDPGVSFISTYHREKQIGITLVSNFGNDVWKLLEDISNEVFSDSFQKTKCKLK